MARSTGDRIVASSLVAVCRVGKKKTNLSFKNYRIQNGTKLKCTNIYLRVDIRNDGCREVVVACEDDDDDDDGDDGRRRRMDLIVCSMLAVAASKYSPYVSTGCTQYVPMCARTYGRNNNNNNEINRHHQQHCRRTWTAPILGSHFQCVIWILCDCFSRQSLYKCTAYTTCESTYYDTNNTYFWRCSEAGLSQFTCLPQYARHTAIRRHHRFKLWCF